MTTIPPARSHNSWVAETVDELRAHPGEARVIQTYPLEHRKRSAWLQQRVKALGAVCETRAEGSIVKVYAYWPREDET